MSRTQVPNDGAGSSGGESYPSLSEAEPHSALRRGPHVTLRERGNDLIVFAEVPGAGPGDVQIQLTKDLLTINGASSSSAPKAFRSVSRERFSGSFSETLKLLSEVDVSRSRASLDSGLLTVTLPKAERVRQRRIEIRAI